MNARPKCHLERGGSTVVKHYICEFTALDTEIFGDHTLHQGDHKGKWDKAIPGVELVEKKNNNCSSSPNKLYLNSKQSELQQRILFHTAKRKTRDFLCSSRQQLKDTRNDNGNGSLPVEKSEPESI
ncbi:hypothetical protein AWZ03_001241 [Drosophila navojoa]|uniref:Uncharacterized protein n=1 Tax=Drosophila navojoa TaxID=7232 RepID=A0A484BXC5_DRONA|nr:hypothetical protein AWZ03_001241 [Drosophila navojoa]